MTIRKAEEKDLSAVEAIYTELLTHEAGGVSHSNWRLGVYPTRAVAQAALDAGTLFVLEEEGLVRASIILNHEQPEEYAAIGWLYPAPAERVLVMHTLCVSPSMAGKGCGRAMVAFGLELAAGQGCLAARLDTFTGNAPARSLYEKLGFRLAGSASVVHQGVIPEILVYYERKI